MMGGKWSSRNEGFEGKKRGEYQKSFNKAGKIVVRRLDTKKETSTQGNSHIAIASQVQKGSWKAV